MSGGAFKLRDADENLYYRGYKAGVIDNLPNGIAYGEVQESRRYLFNF